MIKFIAEFQGKIYYLITNLQFFTFTLFQQSELDYTFCISKWISFNNNIYIDVAFEKKKKKKCISFENFFYISFETYI